MSPDALALQQVASEFLRANRARAAARQTLTAEVDQLPELWQQAAKLGWLGVHLPQRYGGGDGTMLDLAVICEEFGRAVAPGPFVSTVTVSAVIARLGDDALRQRWLPGLADGSVVAGCGFSGSFAVTGDRAVGTGVVIGGGVADVLLVRCGEDIVLVTGSAVGVSVIVGESLDRGKRVARVTVDTPIEDHHLLRGAAAGALGLFRILAGAEAVGGAQQCSTDAVEYAKVRHQFGRAIGTFQAVKHHCANMAVAAELAAAAVWDAARAADEDPVDDPQVDLAAAVACVNAVSAFVDNAETNVQVHGGIGFTWEHDAHLYLRRALALRSVLPDGSAACDVAELACQGVRRRPAVSLPADVEERRTSIGRQIAAVVALPEDQQQAGLLDDGLLVPHWAPPWGCSASPALRLLIDDELASAGLVRPTLGITGWVLAVLVEYGSAEQVRRWVRPGLLAQQSWCQLFSEPGAGSDAAAVETKARRVEGGWIVNGQKIWSSGAKEAAFGLATVRTDPKATKHAGITMLAIDMSAPGVQVRPLRQISGPSEFNEVFLTDVFVSDEQQIGATGAGWTVARSTLGNERTSIGSGLGSAGHDVAALVAAFDAAGRPQRAVERIGRYFARSMACTMINARQTERAVAGVEPGPEGNVTKLVASENTQRLAAMLGDLADPGEVAAAEPGTAGGDVAIALLTTRRATIAGGTAEIVRNQIAERILGLPRDPLIR